MAKMLDEKNSLLLIIDVQEKLVNALEESKIIKKTSILAKAAETLGIPTVVTEQYPKGLGSTVVEVKNALAEGTKIIEKTSFSVLKEEGFLEMLKSYGKKQIVICGIEAHICVHQSASDLIDAGFEVFVAKDACASRNEFEFNQGIERMKENGAKISCVEIILFELLRGAKHPKFKEVQALIK